MYKLESEEHLERILVVEDDPDHLELTTVALKRCSPRTEIISLDDGQEALDYLFATGIYIQEGPPPPPNLILLDLKLPKIDGLEVLRQVKRDERLNTIPIYVLTTSSDQYDMERCYEAGVNLFVTKPPAFHQYLEAVEQLIQFYTLHLQKDPESSESPMSPESQESPASEEVTNG